MLSEYIEREAAIDALTEQNLVVHMDSVNDGLVASCHRSAQRIIANIPTADVRPVVYCKDCKHRGNTPDCPFCWLADKKMGDEHFCSFGEKREGS